MYIPKGILEYSEEELHKSLKFVSSVLKSNIDSLEQECKEATSINQLTYVIGAKVIQNLQQTRTLLDDINLTKEMADRSKRAQGIEQ